MKTAIIALVLVIALGIGGYIGYTKLLPKLLGQEGPVIGQMQNGDLPKSQTVTGVLMKVQNPTDDYTHNLKTADKLVRVASYTVKLDDYVGKTVTITGQPSGTTLFADTIEDVK
jgi:hypothetical protein